MALDLKKLISDFESLKQEAILDQCYICQCLRCAGQCELEYNNRQPDDIHYRRYCVRNPSQKVFLDEQLGA